MIVAVVISNLSNCKLTPPPPKKKKMGGLQQNSSPWPLHYYCYANAEAMGSNIQILLKCLIFFFLAGGGGGGSVAIA